MFDDRNKILSRKNFIVGSAAIAGLGLINYLVSIRNRIRFKPPLSVSEIRSGHFVPPEQYGAGKTKFLPTTAFTEKTVYSWDIQLNKLKEFPTAIPVHLVLTHPQDKSMSVLTGSKADMISVFDWNQGKDAATYTFPEGFASVGHASFTDDAKQVLVTVRRTTPVFEDVGYIYKFEFPSLKLVETVPLERGHSHEILPLGNERYLMGCGAPYRAAAFIVFDNKKNKFEYFPVDVSSLPLPGEVMHIEKCGTIYVANAQCFSKEENMYTAGCLVSFDPSTNETKTIMPANIVKVRGELLSLTYDQSTNYLWVTNPSGSQVIVWNLTSQSLVNVIPVQNSPSSAIALSESEAVIIGTSDRFLAYDSKTLENISDFESDWPHEIIRLRWSAHMRAV